MTQYFDSVKCLIIDKEINDVSVLPKHYCDTTVRAPAKCMQNSAGVQMSPCLYAPWMCHMNRNAGSTTAPTHLSLASSLTRPRPRFWQSMCSALTSQRISHFSGASALFEIHKVHGLKIYNTKTSVLHLKKSRKQFYCPLFFLYSLAFAANAKDTFWAILDFCCCNTMCDHWGKSACLLE